MDSADRTIEVTLGGLVYGGSAIGRLPDGRAVFVPFALPGEKVRVRLTDEKRGHTQAELVEVIIPSEERIRPRCRHFTECGGCHYQHLSYEAQVLAKTGILREQLQRIGGIQAAPVNRMVPSPQAWNYRNHVQFHPARSAGPGGSALGYLAPDSHTVIPIEECHLPELVLNDLWPKLELEPIPGLERIGLRLGVDEDVMLILEGQDIQPPEFSVDMPLSAVKLDNHGTVVLAGDEELIMEVHGRRFQVSPGSFFQVNTPMAAAMVDYLLSLVPPSAQTLMDIYCGVGLFSAFLAPRVNRLVGIELSRSACQDFAVNLDEFNNVELYEGSAEEILPALPLHPDGIVIDPPRSGLDQRALQEILAKRPAFIAYVSCDPATLARDLRRFIESGYQLQSVTPFDLFPQTYHIESISFLTAQDI